MYIYENKLLSEYSVMKLTQSGATPVDTGTREQLSVLNELSALKKSNKKANKQGIQPKVLCQPNKQ